MQVPVVIPEDLSATMISARPLIDGLRGLLEPMVLSKIDQHKNSDGYLTIGDLRGAGIDARIDEVELLLILAIPVEMRSRQVIDLGNPGPRLAFAEAIHPADFSSFFNIQGNVDYLHQGAPGENVGLQPLNMAFESATNLYGNVLQSDFTYSQNSPRPLQRGDVSAIHDDPVNAVRYQAGDLAYPVTGFQSFQPIGGVTLARNFSLQPYRAVQPSGNEEFTLTSASRVEVFVNGQRTEILRLQPGRYNLLNFPFTQGANNVELRITDAAGRVSALALPFFFSNDLLAEGLSEFAYSVGVPSVDVDGARKYRSGTPSVSAFHRLGLSDTLTVGGNFQGNNQQQLTGAEISTATPFGNFRLDIAGSHIDSVGNDLSSRLQYNFIEAQAPDSTNRALQLAATYTGPNFAPLGAATTNNVGVVNPSNPVVLNLSMGYFQTLPYEITGGIAISRQFERDLPDGSTVDLSFRRFLTPRISASVDLSRNDIPTLPKDYRALLTLTLQFDKDRQFVTTSYDTRRNTSTVNWQYLPPADVRFPAANVNLSNSDSQRLAGGQVSYNTSRLETTLTRDETFSNGSAGGNVERRSSLGFGTAFLFADGHYTIGRPVADSFALIVPHPALAGLTVGADPVTIGDEKVPDHYLAEADLFGPAALSNMPAYQVNATKVVVPDLPVGYTLGPDQFQTVPSFHSGAVIEVGTDAVVVLDGILADRNGKRLSLAAGEIEEVSAGGGKLLTFFTNRAGRFRIDGMKPGNYQLSIPALPGHIARIAVPPDAKGIYRIGTIEVSDDTLH